MNEHVPARSQFGLLIADIHASLLQWRFWTHLGTEDILKQYRRSYLGPVWISLNTAIFVLAFSVIGSQIFGTDLKEYLVYFCLGHVVFLFLSSLITEGCQTFTAAEAFLKQTPYPKLTFVLRVMWRNLLNTAHNVPIMLVALAVNDDLGAVRWDVLLANLLLTLLSAFLLVANLGAVCARFRDVPLLIGSVMQISMFLTPVMWKPSQLSENAQIIAIVNPLAAYLELLRAPLMGTVPEIHHYLNASIVLGVLGMGFFTGFLRSRRRLLYWL